MKVIIEQPELNKILQAGLSYLRPELFENGAIGLHLIAERIAAGKVAFKLELDVPEKVEQESETSE